MTDVFVLLKSAITHTKQIVSPSFDFDLCFEVYKTNGMLPLFAKAIEYCGISVPEKRAEEILSACSYEMQLCSLQTEALDEILCAFSRVGINAMPIKGAVYRKLYDEPWLRPMSDCDILVQENQMKKAKKIMTGLGFKNIAQNGIHDVYRKQSLCIELQTKLTFFSYSLDPWSFVTDGTLSDAYSYFLCFFHFVKHYINGEATLKSISDLYYLDKKLTEEDRFFIFEKAKEINADVFLGNVRSLISFCFDLGEPTLAVNVLMDAFEDMKRKPYNLLLHQKGKGKKIFFIKLRKIFPSYSFMKKSFPILKEVPVLLPICYIFRLFRAAFLRERHSLMVLKNIQEADSSLFEKYDTEMAAVGLEKLKK